MKVNMPKPKIVVRVTSEESDVGRNVILVEPPMTSSPAKSEKCRIPQPCSKSEMTTG